jgi:hypothetical protein
VDVVVGAVSVLVLVVDFVSVVADSVLVTVAVFDVSVLLEVVAVAAWALVVVFGVVGGEDAVLVVGVVCGEDFAVVVWLFVRVVVEADVSVGEVGWLTLVVLLVICVRVFEMLLAMLDAPPEPHPATGTVRIPTSAVLNSIDRTGPLTHIVLGLSGIRRRRRVCGHRRRLAHVRTLSRARRDPEQPRGAGRDERRQRTQKPCFVLRECHMDRIENTSATLARITSRTNPEG